MYRLQVISGVNRVSGVMNHILLYIPPSPFMSMCVGVNGDHTLIICRFQKLVVANQGLMRFYNQKRLGTVDWIKYTQCTDVFC